MERVTCDVCSRSYANVRTLSAHKARDHKVVDRAGEAAGAEKELDTSLKQEMAEEMALLKHEYKKAWLTRRIQEQQGIAPPVWQPQPEEPIPAYESNGQAVQQEQLSQVIEQLQSISKQSDGNTAETAEGWLKYLPLLPHLLPMAQQFLSGVQPKKPVDGIPDGIRMV